MNTERIRPIPKFFEKIPLLNQIGGSAVYPYIFLRRDFFEDLATSQPNHLTIAVLTHEETHIARAKEKGPIRWIVFYGLIPSFRVDEELAADREAMKYWKSQNLEYNFDRRARYLSGPLYFWSISYDDAKKKLIEIWEMI